MNDIVFREAEVGDKEGVIGLLKEIMRHHGVVPPRDEELSRVFDSILPAPHHTLYLAEKGGRPLGLCALIFSLSTWRAVQVCEFQDVVVTAQARGSGLGRLLLESALDFAREKGCAWAYLTAEPWNLGAHDFYRRLGFEEKTVIYFEYDLGGEDRPQTGEGGPA